MTTRIVQLCSTDPANPIPDAIRVNNTIYAPHLTGADRATGLLREGLLRQMEAALQNMHELLEDAGASMDNVGRVVGYVTTVEDRDPIYEPWDAHFPDAADRPAFKVLVAKLPPGVLVQLSMFALVGARRERIDIPGVPARDPTVKVRNWIFSSRVHGTDPATGKSPESPDGQADLAYGNLLRLIKLAGGRPNDINQVTTFISDPANAPLAQGYFEKAFSDPKTRPPHWILDAFIRSNLALMTELVATRGDYGPGERLTEYFAHPDADPVAEAVQLGPIIYAPAIYGRAPEIGQFAADFPGQFGTALDNMKAMLARAGTTLGQVGHVTVFMNDLADKPALNAGWTKLYPKPNDRPPHTYVPATLSEGELVRLAVIAVPGGKRKVLEIPGLRHHDPMTIGATMGGLLFSSRIVGTDPSTGVTPSGPADQAEHAFRNVRTLLERAGGTLGNLTQVTAYIGEPAYRGDVQSAWESLFPDAHTRPNLHFLELGLPGPGVRLEIKAAL